MTETYLHWATVK